MKTPLVYSISWLGLAVSMIPLVALLFANAWLWPESFPFACIVVWLCLIHGLRQLLTGAHRKGIRLVKRGRFAEAIPFFERSYAEMCQRPWIDKLRWLILGSCSIFSYREVAACNIAVCHGQTGDGQKMKDQYQKALAEFPDSVLAANALRMIEAVSQIATTTPPTP